MKISAHLASRASLLLVSCGASLLGGCGDRIATQETKSTEPAAPRQAPTTPTPAANVPAPVAPTPPTPAPNVPPAEPPPQKENPFVALRSMALAARTPADAPNRLGPDPTLHAILVDWTIQKGATATLMCNTDGSVSLYTTTGGGFIGAGQHPHVRSAVARLFDMVPAVRNLFAPISDPALPDVEQMRFILVTDEGLLATMAQSTDLKNGDHPLTQFANQVQGIIGAVRMASVQAMKAQKNMRR